MKRLLDEADPRLSALTALVAASEPQQSSPFSKRHVQSRIARALEGGARKRLRLRPALLAAGGVLIAGAAAAAGYSWLAPGKASVLVAPPAAVVAPSVQPASAVPRPAPQASEEAAPSEPTPAAEAPSAKRDAKLRAGEDPSQVAEAVRALRKQGDPARAQALLDQYLKANPHGALAEDALALSIEAAAARKDPRAADYARRYLARYPNGRFLGVAQRALAR